MPSPVDESERDQLPFPGVALSPHLARSCRRAGAALCLLIALAMALNPGHAFAGEVLIRTSPALQPAFASSIPNYVTRCEPKGKVNVVVRGNGTPVSVDSALAQRGNFARAVSLTEGQAFTIRIGTGAGASTYNVRCLPTDFPQYSAEVSGPREAAYYLTTPDWSASDLNPPVSYVALFDNNGVPVWWYRSPEAIPTDADLDPNGDLSWASELDGELTFGVPGSVRVEQRNLDGELVNTFQTVGSPPDFHEAWPLANGNFLIDSYILQTGIEPFGSPISVVDGSFQEVRPDGSIAYSWSSIGHMTPAESIRYAYFSFTPYPGLEEDVLDWQHINSVMPYENGYLVSFRNTGAIYYIEKATGEIVWKLGGTHTSKSLKIVDDPEATGDFGSQHDVRAWPNGTVSIFDNGTRNIQQPRALNFSINAAAGTDTLIHSFTDPAVKFSACCGSARLLPGGDWVIAWGAEPPIQEVTPAGNVVFQLAFAKPTFSYRAVPILASQLSLSSLIDAMNTMYPREPGA